MEYCGLCCTAAPYSAEMGILELAGDVGNWMSIVVPWEDNWIGQVIASVRSPATTG
ncbi:MAG: hypothetical protein Q7O66_04475 [Dehalococcoidia bacterium]|nr:hypothetical protein [Dehalococcoidia bacterium]